MVSRIIILPRRASGWRFDMAIDIKGMTPLLQVFDMATVETTLLQQLLNIA
jgi:hypothetical protein